ncbi:hypothetical protein LINPERPRIM_LOCUS2906 [Linum perenne]
MILLPFRCLKMYTNAPTGHSISAAAANARNPTVGPKTLHRHGLACVPHCTQIGTTMIDLYLIPSFVSSGYGTD